MLEDLEKRKDAVEHVKAAAEQLIAKGRLGLFHAASLPSYRNACNSFKVTNQEKVTSLVRPTSTRTTSSYRYPFSFVPK